MHTRALVNGDPTSRVEVWDRGFQYGDGVFTTLRVRSGIPLFLDHHLARLERDCRRLALPFPNTPGLIREVRSLCEIWPEGVLKVLLTRGGGGRGYRCPDRVQGTRVLSMHPVPDYPPTIYEHGVEVRFCHTRLGINPSLAGIKHLNRLEQVLARAEWSGTDIHEGLMLDVEGWVVEGTMTNLFLVLGETLHTPLLDRCGVAGVMRSLVLKAAAELGLPSQERRLRPEDLEAAEELFLTNSVIGIWPVRRLAAKTYRIGPVTREISRWVAKKIQEESVARYGA
ncbi:aminodeoxychorismate lyase [Candidatus Methylocalor cossyra]|uniref:Aminodeoxychorismate lyase n=1 Tax=Candidatus Methylocalor cossyra TaxID=3108543 RepID=A0ABM9NG82_9GAMM